MSKSSSSSPALRRLAKDFRRLAADPPPGCNAVPMADNFFQWNAIIYGPDGTPWQGAIFHLRMVFPSSYPLKPPVIHFLTPCFHPNIYKDGSICLDILDTKWSPVYDVGGVLASIQSMLNDPNPASPANGEAANLLRTRPAEYAARVRECVKGSIEWDKAHRGETAAK